MSLINDALKRATQTPSSPETAIGREPGAPMQPVDYSRGKLPWFFFPCLLAILAGACWFIVRGIESSRNPSGAMTVHAREPQQPAQPGSDIASAAAPGDSPAAELLAAGIAAPAPETPASVPAQVPHRNFSLEDTSPTPAATSAAPSEAPKPAFKLQGIFFRTANPSATVNGKSVTVGTRINGATVTSITRDGVTLDSAGQTTVLTLESQ